MATFFQQSCLLIPVQTLTINGVPLHTIGRIEQVWENVFGAPELVGEPVHVPLRPGAINVPQVPGAREFGVGILLHGAHDEDQAGLNENWRALARMVWSPIAPLTVKRTLRFNSGDETHTCSAKYIAGLEPTDFVMAGMSKVALRFMNLDGYWYGESPVETTVTGETTLSVPGDADTRKISITLSGGTGLQTLTNTTTGCRVTYNGDTATPVVLNVDRFTAVQAGANVLVSVSHAGDVFWMRMAPGENTFTIDGGTALISAFPAYL